MGREQGGGAEPKIENRKPKSEGGMGGGAEGEVGRGEPEVAGKEPNIAHLHRRRDCSEWRLLPHEEALRR